MPVSFPLDVRFRKEHFFPKLANRDSYEIWKEKGGKSLIDAAREKAGKILKEHWATPLDKDVQRKIADILQRAETELGKSSR